VFGYDPRVLSGREKDSPPSRLTSVLVEKGGVRHGYPTDKGPDQVPGGRELSRERLTHPVKKYPTTLGKPPLIVRGRPGS